MPIVMLMRHAKTTLNKEGKFAGRSDCDTIPEGLKEAKEKFPYNENDFDYIYCSPLKRTYQTLQSIMPNRKPIIDNRIIERYLGEWEDKPFSELSDTIIESYVKGYYDPPGSEPYATVKARVCDFIEELFEKYRKDDRILVISHAGVIRQVRDNFLPEISKEKITNSKILTITNEDYEKYLKLKEDIERS